VVSSSQGYHQGRMKSRFQYEFKKNQLTCAYDLTITLTKYYEGCTENELGGIQKKSIEEVKDTT